jgi:hypothetical protein
MRVKGVLFDALPVGRQDLAMGTETLIFDDGTGLTFASNGSYWRESAEHVVRAIDQRKRALREAHSEIAEVLALAGEGVAALDTGGEK